MKHLIIFLLTLISFTASAQITNNTAWYKFAQKLTVGGKLQIPNDTLTLTAQDTGLIAIKNGQFYYAGVIGGSLQWSEITGGGGSSAWGGITGTLSDQTDLQTALNAKANTSHTHAAVDIVSGIIATARLGSGTADNTTYLRGDGTWQTISSGGTWGSISGTLSSQTDLQSALDAKQATLVSGTNIKTINGTTLLGSGDISITSSSALSALTAATATNTINNANFQQTWQWNSISASPGLKLSSNTASDINSFPVLDVELTGTNPVAAHVTYAIRGVNQRAGSSANSHGVYGESNRSLSGGVYGNNTSAGYGVFGNSSSGQGVRGISSSNIGGYFQSSSGNALESLSTSGRGLLAAINPTSTNTVAEVVKFTRNTSGTAAAGIGARATFAIENSAGAATDTHLDVKLLNATNGSQIPAISFNINNATNTLDINNISGGGVQTTNTTPATCFTFPTVASTSGVMEVTLVGTTGNSTDFITGKKIVRWNYPNAGATALGSITNVLATEASAGISGATWTITTSGNDIIVQVTGVAATTITWRAEVRFFYY